MRWVPERLEDRILIFAPTGDDSEQAALVLREAGLHPVAVGALSDLCEEIARGCGAILLAEEALVDAPITPLIEVMVDQPIWSDVHLFVMTSSSEGLGGQAILDLFFEAANLTLLERPLRVLTLITAVRGALRARLRQYEVRGLLSEKNELIQHAQDAIKTREEFLSIASHELRTPLTSLLLRVDLIQRGFDPSRNLQPSPEQLCQFIRSQSVQLGILSNLVSGLFDVARITQGRLVMEPSQCDLREIVQGALVHLSEGLQSARCRVTTSLETPASGAWDATRMEQVITNLVANSMRHAPGCLITIRLMEREAGRVVLEFSDDGPGIPVEVQPVMFDRFSRGGTFRNTGGLGLGLFIVKEIIQAHGGTITASSPPGCGATFLIEFKTPQSDGKA